MKVLLISHNPITSYQSMGKTFLSLFSEFDRDELCQLYIYPTIPDVEACHSYYRITDRNVFESYLHFGKVNGREIAIEDIDPTKHDFYENDKEESFMSVKKTALRTILRDLMWKFSRWYSPQLKDWIEQEGPTCIFLAPGEAKFIYDIALRISEDYGLPIITYICDEFYFIDKTNGFVDKIRLRLLQEKMRQLMNKNSCIIAISDEIKLQYSKEFNVHAETIMTGATIQVKTKRERRASFTGITYLGNLAYDRASSLIEIGNALDEINKTAGTDVKVYLYTRSLSEEVGNRIKNIDSIKYCGYVTGEEFSNVLNNADALLHIESFNDRFVEKVKNSVSTKIADSLASGNPLIAYAPSRIASMKYLISREAALIITDQKELKMKLEMFISSSEAREEIARKGLKAARDNHMTKQNSLRLHRILETVHLNEKSGMNL